MTDPKPASNENELQLIYDRTRQATAAAIHASIEDAEDSYLNGTGKTKEVLDQMMLKLLPDSTAGKTPAQLAALRKNLAQIGARWIEADPTLAADPDKLAKMYAQVVSNDPDDFKDIVPPLDEAAFKRIYNPDLGKKDADKGFFANLWDGLKRILFNVAKFFGLEGWVAGLAGITIPDDKQVDAVSAQVAGAVKEVFADPANKTKTPEELQALVTAHVQDNLTRYAQAQAAQGNPIPFDDKQLKDMAQKTGISVHDQAASIHQVLTFRETAVQEFVQKAKQAAVDTARGDWKARTRFWIKDGEKTDDIYGRLTDAKYMFNDQQLKQIGSIVVDATSNVIRDPANQNLSQAELSDRVQEHLKFLLAKRSAEIEALGPPSLKDINYNNGTYHVMGDHEDADMLGKIAQQTADEIRHSDPKDAQSAISRIKDAQQKLLPPPVAVITPSELDRAVDAVRLAKQAGLTSSTGTVAIITAPKDTQMQVG